MSDTAAKIIYTHTDEAPALATYSLLPIVEAFTSAAGVAVETRDISLAGRILAVFPDHVEASQRVDDALAELGELAKTPEANIIKLPNISASVPQLKETIGELQADGYAVPDYPDEPSTPDEHEARARYDRVKGSAVNPVLREGNSDRRAPKAVKDYARSNPHPMGEWSSDSKTRVVTMASGDFRSNEQSTTVASDGVLRIEHVAEDDAVTVLKDGIDVLAGEVVDGTFMSKAELVEFLADQVAAAKTEAVLFSLHLKATMMKVSDPIIFGHAVETFFAAVFAEHGEALAAAGADANNGLGNVLNAVAQMPDDAREQIESAIEATIAAGPAMAMVDSDNGITNLHVPSDVIIDASMPAMIRTSGQMWSPEGEQQDTLAVIPDSSYAGLYQATIDFCRVNGAFDPTTMGTVPNVGLMAQKAEEYGSHDKTFEIASSDGTRCSVDRRRRKRTDGATHVEAGDIWRACARSRTRLIQRLGEARRHSRARATGWLLPSSGSTKSGPTTRNIIAKVNTYLGDHDTSGPPRSKSCRRSTQPSSASSGSRAAKTPSRSLATCSATTSPTCSPSSSSAPAQRCCRSCRS